MEAVHEGKTSRFLLQTVVAAANINYQVSLPPGVYEGSIAVDSAVTGTTTAVAIRPFATDAGQVGNADFRMLEPDDNAPITSLTLTAGQAGRFAMLFTSPLGVPILLRPCLPFGLQVTVTKGTAVAGEKCRVVLTVTKLG